ncbi:ogr/Delta-like zinc finger family protein [Serratia plymuthica]|uniref:ogr/Delta-like zinc finger family protein n=1 Tax=Serratia plymuthica TaxID=82996 RepID=UPI0018D6B7BA|nr:ogr/Delta-like zinc finger family protein [Serratia plymuthica]
MGRKSPKINRRRIAIFIYPSCKSNVIAKQVRVVTETTKEKYYYCKNISCLMSFKQWKGLRRIFASRKRSRYDTDVSLPGL